MASIEISGTTIVCCKCGEAYGRKKGNFPVSHSQLHKGSGYMPYCSKCIEKLFNGYIMSGATTKDAVRQMCRKLDLYWNQSIFNTVERTSTTRSIMTSYLTKINGVKYAGRSYDDTLIEEGRLWSWAQSSDTETDLAVDLNVATDESSEEVDQSLVDFWGSGYATSFYAELERRYKDWTEDLPVAAPSERSLYKQICLLEATIARDSAQGKAIDKNVNALNTLLGSMNLKPAQRKDEADIELERMPLGVGIQKWEYSRPLPETPKEKKDICGTIKNITTWYLGHACKMVGLRNSYCRMYEEAMEELRVKHPEFDDEDDDTVLTDIFSSPTISGDE